MSASVLGYQRRDDGNGPLRQRIIEMVNRHGRHGYRMIHLRLRHGGTNLHHGAFLRSELDIRADFRLPTGAVKNAA